MNDNELIAEFMGGVKKPQVEYGYEGAWTHAPMIWVLEGKAEPNLLYHKSWDWLIPVVEKIETLYDTGIFYDGKREPDVHNIRIYAKRGGSETIVISYGKSKIESVYKAVVEFIKWYNSQK